MEFGRKHCTKTKEGFFRCKSGDAVLRRWFILIPTQGASCVRRHRVVKATGKCVKILDANTDNEKKGPKVVQKNIRRIVDTGHVGRVLASHRPCYDCEACTKQNFADCLRSSETETYEIEVEPVGDPMKTVNVTRGFVAEMAGKIAVAAQNEDVLAIETESNDEMYWVVQVTEGLADVPTDYEPEEHWGVTFQFDRREKALKCRRFVPAGVDSSSTFELDSSAEFLVPASLCRFGPLTWKLTRPTRRRCLYEIALADKRTILERCRALA